MAEKRMFAKTVVESGAFYRMSAKAQCLYLHLCMNADDDGMLNNALVICRSLNFNKNILQELLDKRFVLDCGDDVMCIKHWRVNNTIAKDRYKPTMYQEQLSKLSVKENKSYTDHEFSVYKNDTEEQQKNNKKETQIRLDKSRLDKNSIDDEIKIINTRMLEAGLSKSDINNAMYYFDTMSCPKNKDTYLKILDVIQDGEIVNKYAYLMEVFRNDTKEKVSA